MSINTSLYTVESTSIFYQGLLFIAALHCSHFRATIFISVKSPIESCRFHSCNRSCDSVIPVTALYKCVRSYCSYSNSSFKRDLHGGRVTQSKPDDIQIIGNTSLHNEERCQIFDTVTFSRRTYLYVEVYSVCFLSRESSSFPISHERENT